MARTPLVEAARVEASARRSSVVPVRSTKSEHSTESVNLGASALALADRSKDEETPATPEQQDASLLQLLIAVRSTVAEDGEPSSPSNANAHTPAARLMRCISHVIAEERRQFLHYRLQSLVFEKMKPAPQDFVLPDTISSSRRLPDIEVREAWWAVAREHAEVVRKAGTASAPTLSRSLGRSVRKPSGASDVSRMAISIASPRAASRRSSRGAEPVRMDQETWKGLLKHGRLHSATKRRSGKDVGLKPRRASQLQCVEQNSMAYLLASGGNSGEEAAGGPAAEDLLGVREWPRESESEEKAMFPPRSAEFGSDGASAPSRKGAWGMNSVNPAQALPVLTSAAMLAWAPRAPLPSPTPPCEPEVQQAQDTLRPAPAAHVQQTRLLPPSPGTLQARSRPGSGSGRRASLCSSSGAVSRVASATISRRAAASAASQRLNEKKRERSRCKVTDGDTTPSQLPPPKQKLVDGHSDSVFETTLPVQILRNSSKSRCQNLPKLAPRGSVHDSPQRPNLPRPISSPALTSACHLQVSSPGGEASAAQHAYLEELDLRKRYPIFPISLGKCLDFEEGDGMTEAPLDLRHMNLDDDEAVPLLAGLQTCNAHFTLLLLAGNPRLSDATYLPLLQLACARSQLCGVRPTTLDLSGARGLADRTLQLLAQELLRELQDLRVLRMDGITVPEALWPSLETSVAGLLKLEDLSLADMQIGRVSQRSAASVAETLLGLPTLKRLDLSNNFFGLEGCRALGESLKYHKNLERLDMSYNAGGFVIGMTVGGNRADLPHATPVPSTSGGTSLGTCGQNSAFFNPLSLVCEGIARARALKALSLAHCQLNFDEDFLLEDAVLMKSGASMEEIDLSGNPAQGTMGARCLLRLCVCQPRLKRLVLHSIREALPSPSSISYEFGDPSGNYDLELHYPQHRALLRTLLRRCRTMEAKPEDCFKFSADSAQLAKTALSSWQSNNVVPTTGRLVFSFDLPLPSCPADVQNDVQKVISRMDSTRKLRVGLHGFVRVSELFRQLTDVEARRLFVGAMACDLMLKISHVRYLAGLDTRLRTEVTDRLLPAVHQLDTIGGFQVILNARSVSANHTQTPIHVARAACVGLLLFNPGCANAHYELSLSVPGDRRVLEQVIIVNEWERERARRVGLPDLAEYGGHENLRNSHLNGVRFVWRDGEFSMPPRGDLTFDYCSHFHPPADAPLPSFELVDHLAGALEAAVCDPLMKVAVLRSVLHQLNLSPRQCAMLIESLPESGDSILASSSVSRDRHKSKTSRADAFVALYSRCTDIEGLVSSEDHGLYGLHLLSREEVTTVRKRMGKLRTWNILRCDDEELCRWDKLMGPRHTDWRVRKQETEEDERRMQRTLQNHRLLDDPTSRGNANKYALDLGVPEERQMAAVLLKIGQKEPGDHYDEPYWSAKEKLLERGTRWLVPDDWNTKVPEHGIFKVRYCTERGNCKDPELRRALAEKYLGW